MLPKKAEDMYILWPWETETCIQQDTCLRMLTSAWFVMAIPLLKWNTFTKYMDKP